MEVQELRSKINNAFLSIAMPAYNEEGNIEHVVREALKVLRSLTSSYEVLVVNDGSSDRTGEILDALAKEDGRIRVIHNSKNVGIGYSSFVIYCNVKGEYLFWNAADNQIYMEELYTLLPHIFANDIVVGNRKQRNDRLIKRFLSSSFNLVFRLRFGLPVRDVDSVKVFRMSVFKDMDIVSRSSYIESEVLIKAKKRGYRIKEVDIKHHPRVSGKAQGLRLRIITPQLLDFAKSFFGFL